MERTGLRKVIAIIHAVLAVCMIAYVLYEWHAQGCGWYSLAAAIFFYGGFILLLWVCIDQTIKESEL